MFGFGGPQGPHDRGVFFHAQGFPAFRRLVFPNPGMAQQGSEASGCGKKGLAFSRFRTADRD